MCLVCVSTSRQVHFPHLFSLNAILIFTLLGDIGPVNWAKGKICENILNIGAESAPFLYANLIGCLESYLHV